MDWTLFLEAVMDVDADTEVWQLDKITREKVIRIVNKDWQLLIGLLNSELAKETLMNCLSIETRWTFA